MYPDDLAVVQNQLLKLGTEGPFSTDKDLGLFLGGSKVIFQILHGDAGVGSQIFVGQLFGGILQRFYKNKQCKQQQNRTDGSETIDIYKGFSVNSAMADVINHRL